MFDNMIRLQVLDATPYEDKKGLSAFQEQGDCVFKKCCKKYKRGKRCKKCPDR